MKARDYLRQPQKLDAMINNKLIEKDQLKSIALSITPQMGGERVQSSSSQQRMANAIDKIVDIDAEINRLIDRLVDKKQEVISTIEELNVTEYDVLHKLYIQGLTYYDVAQAYGKSYSWATTIHGRALSSLQRVLNEREKGNAESKN